MGSQSQTHKVAQASGPFHLFLGWLMPNFLCEAQDITPELHTQSYEYRVFLGEQTGWHPAGCRSGKGACWVLEAEDKDPGESAMGEGADPGFKMGGHSSPASVASKPLGLLGKNTVSWAPLFEIQIQKIWGQSGSCEFNSHSGGLLIPEVGGALWESGSEWRNRSQRAQNAQAKGLMVGPPLEGREKPLLLFGAVFLQKPEEFTCWKKKKKHQRQNKEHVNVEYLNFW